MREVSLYQYDVKELTQDIPTYAEIIAQTSAELTSLKDEVKDKVEINADIETIEDVSKSPDQEAALKSLIDTLVPKNSAEQAVALYQVYDETRKMFFENPKSQPTERTEQIKRNKKYDAVYQLAMTWIQDLKPEDVDINNTSDDMKQKIMKAKVYISILSTAPGYLMAHHQAVRDKMILLTQELGGKIIDLSDTTTKLDNETWQAKHIAKIENFNKLRASLDIPSNSDNKYADLTRSVLNFGLSSDGSKEIDAQIYDLDTQLDRLGSLTPYQYSQMQNKLNNIYAYVNKVFSYMQWGVDLAVIEQDLQRRIDAVQDREQKKPLQKQKKHLLNKLQQYKMVHDLTISKNIWDIQSQSIGNDLWGIWWLPKGTTRENMTEEQRKQLNAHYEENNKSTLRANSRPLGIGGKMDFEMDQYLPVHEYVQYLQYKDQLKSLIGVVSYATDQKQYNSIQVNR